MTTQISAAPTYRRFVIPEAFSDAACDRLCTMAVDFKPCGVQVDEGAQQVGARTSMGVQLAHGPDTDWFTEQLHPHIQRLNRTFCFDISGYAAPLILRYTVGQQYDWHVDMGGDEIATRKLSVIVLLSHADAYDDGDLEWMPDLGPCPRGRGTLVVFPSFMPHRVTPVSRGERQALVTWVHGDQPFR